MNGNQRYKVRENYFDNIDTEEKAYILGLLYADGSVVHNNVCLSLSGEDSELVYKIRDIFYEDDRPISIAKFDNPNHQDAYRLNIINKHIKENLNRYGLCQNKTLTLSPPLFLSDDFVRHFIRGYFDGDGHIGWWWIKQSKKVDKGIGSMKGNFNIVSTEIVCEWIKDQFSKFGVIAHIYTNRGRNNTLIVSGNQQIKKCLDYMYRDSNLFLARKHKKYLDFLDNLPHTDNKRRRNNGQFSIKIS